MYPSIYLSFHLCIYLSIHPSIYLSIYLSFHLSIYPSILGRYDFRVEHVPGKDNVVADALSRNPICTLKQMTKKTCSEMKRRFVSYTLPPHPYTKLEVTQKMCILLYVMREAPHSPLPRAVQRDSPMGKVRRGRGSVRIALSATTKGFPDRRSCVEWRL